MRPLHRDFLTVHRFHLFDLSVGLGMFSSNIPKLYCGGFAGITLPDFSVEHKSIKEGNKEYPIKVVNGVSFGDVTFRKGLVWYDSDFYYWVVNVVAGKVIDLSFPVSIRKNFIILQFAPVSQETFGIASMFWREAKGFDNSGEHLAVSKAWLLERCIPKRYVPGSDLNASTSAISIAELVVSPEVVAELMVPMEMDWRVIPRDISSIAISAVRLARMAEASTTW